MLVLVKKRDKRWVLFWKFKITDSYFEEHSFPGTRRAAGHSAEESRRDRTERSLRSTHSGNYERREVHALSRAGWQPSTDTSGLTKPSGARGQEGAGRFLPLLEDWLEWRTLFGGGYATAAAAGARRVCFGGCPAASETWTRTTECRAAVLWVPWRWKARWSRDSFPISVHVFVIVTPRWWMSLLLI